MAKRFEYKPTGIQKIDDVGRQLQKLYNHARQGSYATRTRYAEAMERFLKVIVPEFRLQKISNISDKHLEYYAKYQQSKGLTDKYIKNDLSGIRYFHDQINGKYQFTQAKEFNKKVGLGGTPDGRKDRAWTEREYQEIYKKAGNRSDAYKMQGMLEIAKHTGTRLDEAATLRRGDLEKALRTSQLHLKNTKGGRERDISLSPTAKNAIREAIQGVRPGEYVFVPKDVAVHEWKARVQNFILDSRDDIQDYNRREDREQTRERDRGEISYHGLRHFYARETYQELRQSGLSDRESRTILAERLGHGRIEVTYIYVPK